MTWGVEWGAYEPVKSEVAHDRDEFLEVLEHLGRETPYADVSIFDLADKPADFLGYLTYLREVGLRATSGDWLQEVATGLTEHTQRVVTPQLALTDWWTLKRRRLLTALTWPHPSGDPMPEYPFPFDWESGVDGVYGRRYRDVWSSVRHNFYMLARRIAEQGDWKSVASERQLSADIFRECAQLRLAVDDDGRQLAGATVDGLVGTGALSDRHEQQSLVVAGFLLTWQDIVTLAESVGLSYGPGGPDYNDRRSKKWGHGGYAWDRKAFLKRLSTTGQLSSHAPDEMHRRITAGQRIHPPQRGSKYRALFDHLDSIRFDSKRESVTLTLDQLMDLTSRPVSGEVRGLPGPQGRPGLPRAALRHASWWYGPWNPDEADRQSSWDATSEASWSSALDKKGHTRAWMATGLRARPLMRSRNSGLESVRFEPVAGRGSWWRVRTQLREGTYDTVSIHHGGPRSEPRAQSGNTGAAY